jgi:hypothetical protein
LRPSFGRAAGAERSSEASGSMKKMSIAEDVTASGMNFCSEI